MYNKVINLSIVPGHTFQGEVGALYGLMALAAALDDTPPTTGNVVDATVARIQSLIESVTGEGTAKLLAERMLQAMSTLRARSARGEV